VRRRYSAWQVSYAIKEQAREQIATVIIGAATGGLTIYGRQLVRTLSQAVEAIATWFQATL
jgi:hypothetical protein